MKRNLLKLLICNLFNISIAMESNNAFSEQNKLVNIELDTTIDNNDKVEKVEDQESKKSPIDPSIATKPDTEMDTEINKNNKTILITMESNDNDKKIGEYYCTLAQIKNNLFRLTFSTESMEFFNKNGIF